MKKNIIINLIIIISAIPLSGIIAGSLAGIGVGVQYVGETLFESMLRYAFAPLTSGIMSTDRLQTMILLCPLLFFLSLTIFSIVKGWNKRSRCFSVLTGLSWFVIVLCDFAAKALP